MRVSAKGLLAAAALLVIALTPSVADCALVADHSPGKKWMLWGWVALAVVIAIFFGERMMGGN